MRASARFLLNRPTKPAGADTRRPARTIGLDYDTTWARRYPVRLARALVLDDLTIPATRLIAQPHVLGRDALERIDGPVIVVGNHASHLDTAILLASLPPARRHHTVVAAAADYFFDQHWKAALSAFGLGAIPMERTKANRRSADSAAELIAAGWSLVIFPEGGRSPDGWGQEFKGGAAYLAKRCGVPVVPVHLHGTRAVLPRGGGAARVRLKPGRVHVRFGTAMWPAESEDARRFSVRIEAAVSLLADEADSDFWNARVRAARGENMPYRGPATSPWRRAWELPASADPVARRRSGEGDESSWAARHHKSEP